MCNLNNNQPRKNSNNTLSQKAIIDQDVPSSHKILQGIKSGTLEGDWKEFEIEDLKNSWNSPPSPQNDLLENLDAERIESLALNGEETQDFLIQDETDLCSRRSSKKQKQKHTIELFERESNHNPIAFVLKNPGLEINANILAKSISKKNYFRMNAILRKNNLIADKLIILEEHNIKKTQRIMFEFKKSTKGLLEVKGSSDANSDMIMKTDFTAVLEKLFLNWYSRYNCKNKNQNKDIILTTRFTDKIDKRLTKEIMGYFFYINMIKKTFQIDKNDCKDSLNSSVIEKEDRNFLQFEREYQFLQEAEEILRPQTYHFDTYKRIWQYVKAWVLWTQRENLINIFMNKRGFLSPNTKYFFDFIFINSALDYQLDSFNGHRE